MLGQVIPHTTLTIVNYVQGNAKNVASGAVRGFEPILLSLEERVYRKRTHTNI